MSATRVSVAGGSGTQSCPMARELWFIRRDSPDLGAPFCSRRQSFKSEAKMRGETVMSREGLLTINNPQAQHAGPVPVASCARSGSR
jgi:hypothetical protein